MIGLGLLIFNYQYAGCLNYLRVAPDLLSYTGFRMMD
jgi:hypothetical protein